MGPSVGFQQASFSELPPPGYALPESGFPDAEPSQVGAWAGGMWSGARPHGLCRAGAEDFPLWPGLFLPWGWECCPEPSAFLSRFIPPTCLPPQLCP